MNCFLKPQRSRQWADSPAGERKRIFILCHPVPERDPVSGQGSLQLSVQLSHESTKILTGGLKIIFVTFVPALRTLWFKKVSNYEKSFKI